RGERGRRPRRHVRLPGRLEVFGAAVANDAVEVEREDSRWRHGPRLYAAGQQRRVLLPDDLVERDEIDAGRMRTRGQECLDLAHGDAASAGDRKAVRAAA